MTLTVRRLTLGCRFFKAWEVEFGHTACPSDSGARKASKAAKVNLSQQAGGAASAAATAAAAEVAEDDLSEPVPRVLDRRRVFLSDHKELLDGQYVDRSVTEIELGTIFW